MRVKVTAVIDPEADEADSADPSGLSEQGHNHFMDALMELGLDNIEFTKIEDE